MAKLAAQKNAHMPPSKKNESPATADQAEEPEQQQVDSTEDAPA